MNIFSTRTLLWLAVTASAAGCVSAGKYKELEGRCASEKAALADQARSDKAKLEAAAAAEKARLEAAAKEEKARLEGELALARTGIADMTKASAELQGRLDRVSARADQLGVERDRLEAARTELSAALEAKSDASAKMLSKVQEELGESRKAGAQAQSRIADYEKRVAELASGADKLSARATQLDAERSQLAEANKKLSASLTANQDELSKTISALSADKRALEGRLAELERAAEEIRARTARELAAATSTYETLMGELKAEVQEGQIQIQQYQGKLTVNVAETIFFDSGKAEIKEGGRKVLARVGDILRQIPDKLVRIEGHTDNVPIAKTLRDRYPTNWELSTARATTVARFLVEKAGVDPAALAAAGYGEYRPVAANDAPEGRAKNRRIEIVLVDKEAGRAQ